MFATATQDLCWRQASYQPGLPVTVVILAKPPSRQSLHTKKNKQSNMCQTGKNKQAFDLFLYRCKNAPVIGWEISCARDMLRAY
jgi:hypothetical protein